MKVLQLSLVSSGAVLVVYDDVGSLQISYIIFPRFYSSSNYN